MEVTTGHLNVRDAAGCIFMLDQFKHIFRWNLLCMIQTIQEYAGDGLRTLVLAYKDLEESYMEGWRQRHHEASTAMEGREERLDELYEEIEKDMIVGSISKTTVEKYKFVNCFLTDS